eukprot:gene9221-5304_t
MEHMVKARLQYHLEANHLLPPEQAGFRWTRGCEEQIIRVTQDASDGFAQGHVTLFTLIDFARCFDTIYRQRLFSRLLDMGVPAVAVRWVRAFLSDRRGVVRCGGHTSAERVFEDGLPQGTVLAPLLMAAFAADLPKVIRGADHTLGISLYADDLAITCSGADAGQCRRRVQAALDRLARWCAESLMEVNTSKSEYILLVPSSKKAAHIKADNPPVRLEYQGVPLQYKKAVRFLGVIIDEALTFSVHIDRLKTSLGRRAGFIHRLAGSSWGCRRKTLRKLHLAYCQSKADYGLATYGNHAYATHIEPLGVLERSTARKITGCTKDTRNTLVMREADLIPIAARAEAAAARTMERYKRLPEGVPARTTAERQHPPNAPARTWRGAARSPVNLAAPSRGAAPAGPAATSPHMTPTPLAAAETARPGALSVVRHASRRGGDRVMRIGGCGTAPHGRRTGAPPGERCGRGPGRGVIMRTNTRAAPAGSAALPRP